ncbi:protein HUA2-LIKE 3 isoform X2 [Elaeis guineensis]|uniref:Protein HUA2-LIKE 2 isoform X2 n=1 Tax=Elaeis guineensis var. tenera TaxID=51953 RepID=A0A6I9Q8J7_ELAGV|nr:protein HUA2-LIKE 2 isoform X2 [Elaeis guineensis]XP_010905254.1 protein HUA2-LIKE 2 isoform X2 [Elaeis guineensis]
MAPSRRKGSSRAAAAAAAAQQQWKVGDLVLAKMKGFPAWPAMITEPEKWGLSSVRKKVLVYFYGTKQIAFCNYADIEAFTEEKKKSLLIKRQGKGADFVRAIDEIIDVYEALKKQTSDQFISGDDGDLGINRSNSFRKSPEHSSHIADDQRSGALCAKESHDVINSEETSATSAEGDPHNINAATDEPAEKVLIIDQLRQAPLATSTTSRKKRLRDAPAESFIAQKKITSLRRSRNSSGGDPPKIKKSDILHNDTDSVSDNVTTDGVQEDSMINRSAENMPHASDFHDVAVPVTAGFLGNGSSGNTACETAATKYEANLNERVVLDPSCKFEVSANGCLESEVRQNGQLDLPMKTVIFKKKRKPNRKRASNSSECAGLDKDIELQVEPSRSLSESPNSRGEINETDHKADGDEHLPLVKRARVRMGEPPVEEKQFDELHDTNDNSGVTVMMNNCDKYSTSTSPRNNCLTNGTSLGLKEASNSSPINDCSHPSGSDRMIWKAKKYQLKSFTLDVEAALPPSKRLHRALEAMSANAAEATDDCPRAPRPKEMMLNNCMVSLTTSSLHLSTDGKIESPTRFNDIPSTECNVFHTSRSGLSAQNLDVPTLASSEVKTDDVNSEHLRSPHDKHGNEVLVDVKNYDGSSVSKAVDVDIHDKSMRPCFFRLTEQVNLTDSEGMPDRSSSPSGKVNENEILQPEEECPHSPVDNILSRDQTVKPSIRKPDSVLSSKGCNDSFSPDGAFVTLSATNGSSTTSGTFGPTKSSSIQLDEDAQTRDMEDVAREVKSKVTPRDRCSSPDLTPMKDLIAAAQAKRLLSRSTSFSDNYVDYKVEAVLSPSLASKEDSFGRGSPSNPMINYTCAIDDRLQNPRNNSRSPFGGLRQKSLSKLTDHAEAYAARKSFEALLCTLTRTKESIGRATRLAIDCAKYGIAGEVVDVLLQNLEREPSLYRRVDLFFLVDSITQCSRSQKGGAGDMYPSLVQSVLPRLLSAAAPPGNAAWENRRQCLKVLRLWLERKTLPESIIRQHIRELDSVNEASFTSTFSRRPSRTERALNDPIREMEGMLVDEYGSNTSFQLPCLLHTTVLEDEEASASDEKSFEAVTPERHAAVDHEKGITQISTEKHRHILEDVDGELEMEDVAPPCEVEVSSSCHVSVADTICNNHNQPDQHHSLPFAPPLPEDRPPSPPPLPSSPPPLSPPCSAALSDGSQQQSGSHAVSDTADLHLSSITHNMQNQQSQSVGQQPSGLNTNLMSSELVVYYTPGYGGPPKQMPPPVSSLSSSSYGIVPVSHPPVHSGNDFQPIVSAPMTSKAYHLQPPSPTVSNQFSYVKAETQQRVPHWGNCSAFTERFQCVDIHGGNFYGRRGARGLVQQEIVERGRFSPAFHSGPSVSGKVEASPASLSHYGPPSEPPSIPCPGWPPRPRMSSYIVPASRPSTESPVSRVAGATGFWRPR